MTTPLETMTDTGITFYPYHYHSFPDPWYKVPKENRPCVLRAVFLSEYEDYVIEYLSPRPIETVAIFLFALILIIGVCGNVLVILVVFCSKRMVSDTFYLSLVR